MTVSGIAEKYSFKIHNVSDGNREITGVYAGDLLSWVMGHAECDQCLVTIMSNLNVLAVASLLDLSCVILAEGVEPDVEFLNVAKEKGINVISSKESTYTVCTMLYEALK